MKTVEEFIQRLQDDPAFAKEAHAFDHGDDLIAFVERQGYDFTLEQLMSAFARGEQGAAAASGGPDPPPAGLSASHPPHLDPPEFPREPQAFGSPEGPGPRLETRKSDVTLAPPREKLPRPKETMPPREAEEESRAGLFRGGGGRHRGFSLQRLKSASGQDP